MKKPVSVSVFEKNEFIRSNRFSALLFNKIKNQIFLQSSANFHNDVSVYLV